MSVQVLIDKWEESLAQALARPGERESELPAKDLIVASGVLIRSKLQGGSIPPDYTKGCCKYSL